MNTTTDLKNAVTLYTHLWGGFSNAIFPVPDDTDKLILLQYALESINPDYIFLPEQEIPENVTEILDEFPSRCLKLSSERIEDIANLNDHLLGLPLQTVNGSQIREFPHIIRVLNSIYKNPLSDTNICLISDNSIFEHEIFLQFGKPSNQYQGYLKNHLNARSITIDSIEFLLKASLLTATRIFTNSLSMTKMEIVHTQSSGGWSVRDHEKVCNLFLYESNDINIAAIFWNYRRLDIGYINKFCLPKKDLLQNLEECISILSKFFLSMQELIIYVNLSNDEAINLANQIHNNFNKFDRNIFVRVFYNNSGFDFQPGNVYSSKPVITTREISSLDKSIRFSPIIPSGHENSNYLFGYDAEIDFASGESFSAPFTQTSAVLLSNHIRQVEYSENAQDPLFKDWQQVKTQPVRPANKGVTGLVYSNEECRIYLPESEEIIARWLKIKGLFFELNDHTRYAKGFIKRFGGFDKTRDLIMSGGAKIFRAFGTSESSEINKLDGNKLKYSHKSEQSGLKFSEIKGYLERELNLIREDAKNTKDAKNIVEQNLPALLEAGLLYRGYALKCPYCGLKDWYKLEKINEFVECNGCAENFQLDNLDKLEFAYKPNELAARFLKTGGEAVLSTAVFLSWLASYRDIQLGGDISRLREEQSFAEIDLFILVKNVLILAECKSWRVIDESKANDIIKHLEKVIETAVLVNAKVVVLGIVTTSITCDLHSLVSDVAQNATEKGIGVHLLLNDTFYLWGQKENEIKEKWQLNVGLLVVSKEKLLHYQVVSVGEPIRQYSWDEGDQLVDRNLVESWRQEF
ncbi:hypothetical protein [Aphanizomenon flos-aquae]|uniref:Uncharacterized protein n=1 Tax=Aphanizomenon flos-aquae FACHB-1040 TaxID=2692887 RepID=A0ABR8BYD9_APHFL|nr:hypothetical protein [Aphanizomenon flos-aquae]MBD2279782.1 hypothetical protein [Aphanizomenon flos-aquae FACHB-1040]